MNKLLVQVLLMIVASAGFAREVRVGYYRYGSYHGQSADGRRSGFGYELYEMLAKKAGWQNLYVGGDRPWKDMMVMVVSGEVEILDCVRKTAAREKVYEYSALPTGYSCGYVLVRADETRYAENDYANWGCVRVGSMSDGSVGDEFRDFAALRGFELERREFATEENVLEGLRSGSVDMAVVESTYYVGSEDLRIIAEINPKPCYFCTKKGNAKLMAEIDRAMAAISEENPAWYVDLRRRHFPVRDVFVYLPRGTRNDEVRTRYLTAMANHLAAIGNWNPVLRTCAEDYSDADLSAPCVVAHVHRTPDNLKKFDFPFLPACRRPICLACSPDDARFLDASGRSLPALPRHAGPFKVGYDRTEPNWVDRFRTYAAERKIAYTLVPFDSNAELRRAASTPEVDLAVLGIDPKDEFRRVAECGSVEFDFATPKEQPAVRQALDMAVRYMRYHESDFTRRLERNVYGIKDVGRIVRAGVYAEFGGVDIAEDGTVSGCIVDYLREVARYASWDLIFVPMTYTEVFDCLAAGEIDVAAAADCHSSHSPLYDRASRNTGLLRYALNVKADSKILPNRPDLWTGNRIGHLSGSRTVDELKRYLDGIGAKYQLVPYTRIQDALVDVRAGNLEGVFTLHARESRDFRTVAIFSSIETYFCVNRRRPDLRRDIDDAMDYFASNYYDFNWWLQHSYLKGSRELLMLDADEIAFVRRCHAKRGHGRKIVVGLPVVVDPICHFDEETGAARGFIPALIREIAKKAGLEVSFTGRGKADFYIGPQESMDNRDDVILDREWFPLPVVRLSLPEEKIPSSVRGLWAVEAKRRDEIDFLSRNNYRVRTFASREECYRAVAEGRVEATIDNSGTARLMIDEHREFSELKDTRISPSQWTRQTAIAFSSDAAPELRSILNKARVAISPSATDKMLVDAIVECRQERFSREDLIHYGVLTGIGVALLLGIGYFLMYVHRQQEAARARTKFFFNVSHDIRTPIHAIMGFVDIGLDSLDDRSKVKDCFIKAKGAGDLLLSLINSVLDMSRIEANKVKFNETVADVYLSFVSIESTLQELAREKGVRLSFGFGDIADRFVYADYEICSRIFVNIITNAIKYTRPGGAVEVACEQVKGERLRSCEVEKLRSGKPPCSLLRQPLNSSTTQRLNQRIAWYRYTFTDNGIGMSEDFQKRLYEKFSRENNTTMCGVSGLGLGMAICKSFVDLIGGRIDCRSKLGEGTTFTVTLPFRVQEGQKFIDPLTGSVRDRLEERKKVDIADGLPPSQSGSEASRRSFKGLRALLVDDSRLNREVARHYLTQAGFEVDMAENGQEAVEKVCPNARCRVENGKWKIEFAEGRSSSRSPYDIVLMDIQMPIMDGYEATKAIRRSGFSRIPVIAWTANAFDEDQEAARAAGMDGHIAKGAKVNALLDVLEKFCGDSVSPCVSDEQMRKFRS